MKNLSFPLYHTTSSIFLKSIKDYGLGGKHPVKEFNVINLMKKLEDIANLNLYNIAEWNDNLKLTISSITNQSGLFSHKSVYVTSSYNLAKSYSRNIYGSEAISETYNLLNLLQSHNIKISDSLKMEFRFFFDLIKTKSSPVILRINILNANHLESGIVAPKIRTAS